MTVAYVNLSEDVVTASVEGVGASVPRQVYALTPDGPANSSSVLLNGSPLSYSGGRLSPLTPVTVTDPTVPLLLPAHSYGFVVFPNAPNPCA